MTDHGEGSVPASPLDTSSTPIITVQTTKAPKDKSCPFCKTPYTASSLGRHLDSYIRDKNPKPPDGVHNVDEIRRMREGITRRNMMVKASGKRASSASKLPGNRSAAGVSKDEDEDEEMDDDDDDSTQSFLNNAPVQLLNGVDSGEKMRWRLNHLNWQATGVISDLPPRSASVASEVRRDGSRQRVLKADHEARRRSMDENDTAIAAEMALKEVLGRLKDASSRSAKTGLYDFDLFELNFPALCLKILPVPSTLKSRTPFPSNDSWALLPPGSRQWETLQKVVKERIAAHQRVSSMAHVPGTSPLPTPSPTDIDTGKIYTHLNDAWNHWQALNPAQRMEAWQLESLRMFSEADEARKETQRKLQEKVQENEELQRDLAALRRDMELGTNDSSPVVSHPPGPLISPKTLQDLWSHGFDARQWEYESLIEKWKAVMRERRQSSNGMAAQRRLSAAPAQLKPIAKRRDEARGRTGQKSASKSTKNRSTNRVSDQSAKSDQANEYQDAEGEIIDVDEPLSQQHHQQQIPPQPSRTPIPPSPHIDTSHLTPLHIQQDQRRSSIQLSPHSIPNQHDQQRRHSIQYHQISPQPQPAPEPPAPQAPMMQFPQPPLLQIPGPDTPSSQPMQMQSPFSAQTPQMQNWLPPQHQHHPLSAVSISPQPPPPGSFGAYAGMGLQVPPPQPDGRRGSHPLIDASGQHVDMQGVDVDAPPSAGGYMDARMQHVGMEGVQVGMGFVGPGMDMPVVGATGGRVG